jgi:hypothetical protein
MFIVVVPILLLLFWAYCRLLSILPLLKRLRWLFLSLFVLHLWFTPADFAWLPSLEGLWLALERVGALIVMVLAAHLLLTITSTQQMIAAWQWWLWPFSKIGLSTDPLAVRLALVLDTVQAVQNFYIDRSASTTKNPLKKISNKVAGLFAQVLIQAERAPLRTLEIPQLTNPPWWQWSYPLLLLMCILVYF